MLYLDLPTADELADLATQRHDMAVSVILPTTPISIETDADRILLKNLTKEALTQLQATVGSFRPPAEPNPVRRRHARGRGPRGSG
jgi:hypothetical protein